MQIDSPARPREQALPIGTGELAEGLMLVRASALKSIRLQLALERNDRRATLAAVDDLLALDRRLQDYLSEVPADGSQLLFRSELDADRAALDREKLTLVSGIVRRPEPLVDEPAAADDWLGPRDLAEPEPPRRRRWAALAVPAFAAAIGGGLYAIGLPQAQAWLVAAAGALR